MRGRLRRSGVPLQFLHQGFQQPGMPWNFNAAGPHCSVNAVQEVRRRTARTIELRSLDPGHAERKLPVRDIVWIARVVWASQ